MLSVPLNVQSEMTACVAVLALSGEFPCACSHDPETHIAHLIEDLKPQLLEMGICEVLIPLTNSPSIEVQGNSAAAIGNLSSKGIIVIRLKELRDKDR